MLDGDGPDGATPLDPDERQGLRPAWVATRADLNRAEQANITKARLRLARQRLTPARLLTDTFVRDLHKRMFGDVWAWAGQYRLTERNIGWDPHLLAVGVRDLVADAQHWIDPASPWGTLDEAILRVHHRLVAIHPFPNGNGRHARMLADELAIRLGLAPYTWGGGDDLQTRSGSRATYLQALKAADRNPDKVTALVAFARSSS